jgi:hypothetical protein
VIPKVAASEMGRAQIPIMLKVVTVVVGRLWNYAIPITIGEQKRIFNRSTLEKVYQRR